MWTSELSLEGIVNISYCYLQQPILRLSAPKLCFLHTYRLTQQKVSKMKPGEANSETEWDELVREIWKENGLKHLRDAATPLEYEESVIHNPTKGTHGNPEITEEDELVFTDKSDHDELDKRLPQNQPAQDEPTHSVSHPRKT